MGARDERTLVVWQMRRVVRQAWAQARHYTISKVPAAWVSTGDRAWSAKGPMVAGPAQIASGKAARKVRAAASWCASAGDMPARMAARPAARMSLAVLLPACMVTVGPGRAGLTTPAESQLQARRGRRGVERQVAAHFWGCASPCKDHPAARADSASSLEALDARDPASAPAVRGVGVRRGHAATRALLLRRRLHHSPLRRWPWRPAQPCRRKCRTALGLLRKAGRRGHGRVLCGSRCCGRCRGGLLAPPLLRLEHATGWSQAQLGRVRWGGARLSAVGH